jgi:hypothetical protein
MRHPGSVLFQRLTQVAFAQPSTALTLALVL